MHRGILVALLSVTAAAASLATAADPAPPQPAPAAGCFVRFRVDALPAGAKSLAVTAIMKIHTSPWNTPAFPLTPKEGATKPGTTPWMNLRSLPGGANGSLILTIPAGAKGATQFATAQADAAVTREIAWDGPDGRKIIVEPGGADIRTFRDQERRYYLRSLDQAGGRLHPLARPPLFFGNAWGRATGGAAEYMVKTFRMMGFNSVVTAEDAAKYEKLYGWHSQGGQYGPPAFIPYDEASSRAAFDEHYRVFFGTGKGKDSAPGMRIFQLADEPAEAVPDPKLVDAGFRPWLESQGLKPDLFGKPSWDEVRWSLGHGTPEQNRLHYWSRRYQNHLTPKWFALAAEAVRKRGPNPDVQSYVALSGHALYMPSRMPLDMFALARHPGLMPGISDWMTGGSWNWDSHQAVAFSVAPFNAGARRYGADFGKQPVSFPMMHCVNPSLFRAYTQLANQCKFISYYNYGPDYEATEGFWSNGWQGYNVQHVNNQAAQMDDILGPGLVRPSRVAMLYSHSQEIWWPQASFADKRASFLALAHEYYQPELVTEQQVADGALEHYDALYVLDRFVSRAAQAGIERWVQAGGLLWACADAATGDEYQTPHDLLLRFAGLARDHAAKPGADTKIMPADGETLFAPHDVPAQGRSKEIVRPCGFLQWSDAKVRGRYADQTPAWVEKKVGAGKVVYIGHRCGLSYSRLAGKRGEFKWWPDNGQRQLLFAALREAGVDRELTLSAPLVMAAPLSTADGTVIILYNMAANDQTDLTLTLKEPSKPHSVQWCDGARRLTDLPFTHADGRMTLNHFSLPRQGAMIVVRRRPPPAEDRWAATRRDAELHLASADWQAASAGAWFAGFFPDWKLAPKLVPLLAHEHWAVRRSAAEAIGRLGHAAAAADLRAALDKESDAHALADELYALVQLRHPDAARLCEKHRSHADPFIRAEAGRAAGLLDQLQSAN